MSEIKTNRRLLMISLDGLSVEQFTFLREKYNFLDNLPTNGHLHVLNSTPLNTAQAVWGEILTGSPWYQTACIGYSFPNRSLNDLEITREATLKLNPSLAKAHPCLAVNIPLLEAANRLWLSDGSFSQELAVSPYELSTDEPFKSYRARAFAASTYCLGNPVKGVKDLLSIEYRRLECATKLVQANSWQTALIRLSAFDLLAHLLGSDFLSNKESNAWIDIESFLIACNDSLGGIINSAADATICVMSAYSHSKCLTRVNLNLLLAELGLCTLSTRKEVLDRLTLRTKAALALAPPKSEFASVLVAATNQFNTHSTQAASPVYGAIYINSIARFEDGIVNQSNAASLKDEIVSQLTARFKDSGIDSIIELNPLDNQCQGPCTLAPDLMIYANGVDFHDTYDAPAIDAFSHPATSHSPEGFAWLNNMASQNSFKPIDLNRTLLEQSG